MSTLVFSDTHFAKKFDKKRFNALKSLILKSEKIIINGDFWEGLTYNFEDFLQSTWRELFPLLKQKDTVYVYGNHDYKHLSDDRVYMFCNKAVKEYILEMPNRTYLFRHGHEFLFPKHPYEELWKNRSKIYKVARKLVSDTAACIQRAIFGLFGPKAFPVFINHMSATVRRKAGKPQYLLVCGHTHRPFYSKRSNFIDIGFFNYGWANYLTIDNFGDFKLHSHKY